METLYAELGYEVRYGKGNFNSGACILKDSNIIVINKLFNTESRINALIDLMPNIEIKEVELSSVSDKLLKKVNEMNLEKLGVVEDEEILKTNS